MAGFAEMASGRPPRVADRVPIEYAGYLLLFHCWQLFSSIESL